MRQRKGKIPKFRSFAEEARFFDTRDTTDFLGEFKPARLKFPKPRRRLISLRLPESEIIGLKRMAARRGVGYLTLIRTWIAERFFRELGRG